MILLIDNYDSFTFNLVQLIATLSPDIEVRRNDEISLDDVRRIAPTHIVLSPGPGHPSDSQVTVDVIREQAGRIPILGVCLGHQAIGMVRGATVARASRPLHGKTDRIDHDGNGIFRGVPSGFRVARYHSLALVADSMPDGLEVCARTADGEVMAVRDRRLHLHGVQFHPESFLSEHGDTLMRNFLNDTIEEGAAA